MGWPRWPRWPRNNPQDLARYVLPDAIYLLQQPDRSFDLAQQPDILVHAIYDLLCERDISYAREEFSTHEVSQYIRTPEEILDSHKGTCLELAVLFCGLCLGNNLLPLLILFENHAITAVSLSHNLSEYNARDRKELDDYFKNGILDRDQLKGLQELLKRELYLVIECTGFVKADFPDSSYPETQGRLNGLLTFKQAREAGEAQLYNPNREFRCAIDIATLQYALDYDPYRSDRYLKLKNIQQPDRDDLMEKCLRNFVSSTRERELEEIKKLIEQCLSKGGYTVITGRAGQGKTSLLAKLVEDYSQKQSIVYHFIPVHPTPAHQVTLLRSIMANLALKHPYLSDLFWVDNEDRGGLVDNFKAVLKEISKSGEQEVIFIDGLDQILPESDIAKRDLSFLLDDLAPGIVIVVSTRPDDLLQPLRLKTNSKLYELPNLSQSDFEMFLRYRGLNLATEVVNNLYEKYLVLVTQEPPQAGIELLRDNPVELFGIALKHEANSYKAKFLDIKHILEQACIKHFVKKEPTYQDECDAVVDLLKDLSEILQDLHKSPDIYSNALTFPLNYIQHQVTNLQSSMREGAYENFYDMCPPSENYHAGEGYNKARNAIRSKIEILLTRDLDSLLEKLQ
ncbi:MAG TPA: AAA family ATPase [Ktedonobacteraceae bacterium]|nr:AAA family ATPase [Ktedonobacteraceae bacterium]